ncbi:MAG: hypothetical protein EPN76_01290 [Burkholderiaceae bacterium]|nr:MAG: hypothetical protein EPN76_01290 [Burkholderiaceae bacterium]TAM09689.1 MAG: hypothetical protein EPN67_01480 [Pusillimonas sp.]
MKTLSMCAPRWMQPSRLGQWAIRFRFWIGVALGGAIALILSGSLSSLATAGAGAVLLSVLPCALMVGVCMRTMHHGDGDSLSENKAPQRQVLESAQAVAAIVPIASSESLTMIDPNTQKAHGRGHGEKI